MVYAVRRAWKSLGSDLCYVAIEGSLPSGHEAVRRRVEGSREPIPQFCRLDRHRAAAVCAVQPVPGPGERDPAPARSAIRSSSTRPIPAAIQSITITGETDHRQDEPMARPCRPPARWSIPRTRSTSCATRTCRSRFRPPQTRLVAHQCADLLAADAAADRRVDLLHAPDAVGRRQGHGLRQDPRQAADRDARAASPSRTSPASMRPRKISSRSSTS